MEKKYFVKDNYYFDIDSQNQLRLVGPRNHLLLGWSLPDLEAEIVSYYLEGNQLVLDLVLNATSINLHYPVMGEIRTLREYSESAYDKKSYKWISHNKIPELAPNFVSYKQLRDQHSLTFKSKMLGTETNEYGVNILIPNNIEVQMEEDIHIHNPHGQKIPLTIKTINQIDLAATDFPIFIQTDKQSVESLPDYLSRIYRDSELHVKHLIEGNKTSSFEYGTIFPRDWMESADLGFGDLTAEAIDYMYRKAMEHVSNDGEGWHETNTKLSPTKDGQRLTIIDRKMIDIEAHYILGLRHTSNQFLLQRGIKHKLLNIGRYIIDRASRLDLITFKPDPLGGFMEAGNWRDSENAYIGRIQPIAPYDVNCVLYPESIRIILEYKDLFGVEQRQIEKLIEKWEQVKKRFKFQDDRPLSGYSLALHSPEEKQLSVDHLDESYSLFYGNPSIEDVYGFTRRVMSPDYFYTPVGPILVGVRNKDYSTSNYHGHVIWPKQAGFVVAGLAKQYYRGLEESWPKEIVQAIKVAVIRTSEACFRGWKDIGLVPELYYYDSKQEKARLYTDQKAYEGVMNTIQLWSAVAARRIINEYLKIKTS